MPGLEDLFGKLMTEDVLKSIAEGMKEGMKEGNFGTVGPSVTTDESWVHVNNDKPVKFWIVIRINGVGVDFCQTVAQYKKYLAAFLKQLPEGQGVVFLPGNATLEVTPWAAADLGGK